VLFLQNPIVFGLVLMIFLIALFIELTHPGLILPGTVAALALFTLIAPAILNDMASWWMVAAILAGLVCLGLEAFVIPGFGVFGVVGILLLFGGLVGTFVGGPGGLFPDSPEGKSNLLYGAATVLISASTSAVAMYFIAKHFGSLPFVNRLVLKEEHGSFDEGLLAAMEPASTGPVRPGAIGIALTPLRPAGRVQIGDKIVDVVSDLGFVPPGGSVRVLTVDHFRVTVEPVSDGTRPGRGAAGEGGGTA
jgi:membrane-bound serine protease (ClpP class)